MTSTTDVNGHPHAALREPVRTIVQRLLGKIDTEFGVGARLPAERHLAEEFGVTRSMVREALDFLEEDGIVTRRAGSGSFVARREQNDASSEAAATTDAPGQVLENTGPLELQVVRGIVEPEMVRLAVMNMTPAELHALRQVLDRMEGIRTDAEAFARAEEAFFMQIARSTDNALLIAVYQLVNTVRQQSHWRVSRHAALSPSRMRESQRRFGSILEAIERRDVESAVEFVKLQLIDEQRVLMRDG